MKKISLIFLLVQFSAILFAQNMIDGYLVVKSTITKNAYLIYDDLGDAIPFRILNQENENILSESTQIYVDDSFFAEKKNFHISGGFKLNGKWIQDYTSDWLPLNLISNFGENHLDTVEIVNGSLLRVEYDDVSYITNDVIRKKTEVILGAHGFFDKGANETLTIRWSIDNNDYITNSPRIPETKLGHWDKDMIRDAIRSDSIWVEEYKLSKKE